MRKYRLRVGLDVDDTIYECNSYALSIINSRHHDEEPVSINEITGWGHYGIQTSAWRFTASLSSCARSRSSRVHRNSCMSSQGLPMFFL